MYRVEEIISDKLEGKNVKEEIGCIINTQVHLLTYFSKTLGSYLTELISIMD